MDIDANSFQLGLALIATATLVMSMKSDDFIEKLKIEDIKNDIVKIMAKNDRIFISDLADQLHQPPSKIKIAVNQLVEDGFLKE